MIRAVIFDFNGVLIDDEPVHFALFRDVLAEEGVALTAGRYHDDYLGYDDWGCFEHALRDAGLPAGEARVDQLVARKADRYVAAARHGLKVFDGAAQVVATIADRWPVAICSGALRAEIQHGLDLIGVRDRVAAIISAEDAERCKPDPEGYLLALDALRSQGHEDLEAAHCLVIEDSLAGVQSAKGAGMWVVGLAQTYSPAELRGAGADAVIGALAELTPATISSLFAPEVSP